MQKNKSQADPEYFFPLTVMALKAVRYTKILPKIVPFLLSHGLFIAGRPGVGKTQVAKILAMAFGRWRAQTTPGDAGWRRGSQIDVFTQSIGWAPGDPYLDPAGRPEQFTCY